MDPATGNINGTWAAQGHYVGTCTAEDSSSTVTPPTTWSVDIATPLGLRFATLIATTNVAEVGIPFYRAAQILGATGVLTPSVLAGALPPGFALSITGGNRVVLSGTATANGIFYADCRVTDDGGTGAWVDFSTKITVRKHVGAVPPVFSAALATVGQDDSGAVVVDPDCGVPPFTYAVTANTIASGVDVDRTSGKMKGTATAITPHTVPPAATITITDALGATTTVSARVQVNAPAPAAPPGYFAAGAPIVPAC